MPDVPHFPGPLDSFLHLSSRHQEQALFLGHQPNPHDLPSFLAEPSSPPEAPASPLSCPLPSPPSTSRAPGLCPSACTCPSVPPSGQPLRAAHGFPCLSEEETAEQRSCVASPLSHSKGLDQDPDKLDLQCLPGSQGPLAITAAGSWHSHCSHHFFLRL